MSHHSLWELLTMFNSKNVLHKESGGKYRTRTKTGASHVHKPLRNAYDTFVTQQIKTFVAANNVPGTI